MHYSPNKLCLFDLDGTLVHHENDHFYNVAITIYNNLGKTAPSAQYFNEMLEKHTLFSDIPEIERQEFQLEFWKCFEKANWPMAREIDGAVECLERFVIAGSKVAIVTARTQLPDEVEHCLKDTGLLKHIHVVSTMGEPDLLNRITTPDLKVPQIYKVCKRVGVPPNDCMLAGDAPHDITSAQLAGVNLTVALLSGGARKELLESVNPNILTESVVTMCNHFKW